MTTGTSTQPLVFACSGCSNAGQLANQVALELDRRGAAEMSCLAGVGAGKRHFLKQLAARPAWVVDGCPIECALGLFQRLDQPVAAHLRLHDLGRRKNDPMPTPSELNELVDQLLTTAAASLAESQTPIGER
ncbi:MAG: putative zinc-binding protein [Pirellulales bacterium]|nr:putative zinc-binding protein [Pirellulales bacterium]